MSAPAARGRRDLAGHVAPPGSPAPAARQGPPVPTLHPVTWTGRALRLLDQTALPERTVHIEAERVADVVDAIRRLAVRGAPALGLAGAFGVALALVQARREGWDGSAFTAAVGRLRSARPTAVALVQGVDAAYARVDEGLAAVVAVGTALAEADERTNRSIGRHGADWILDRVSRRPLRVLTHCNTGALATAGWGTALGVIRELHRRGQIELVHVDETRPLLQGSRLTAWELGREGIPHLIQVDSAAAATIVAGLIDVAVVGADRVAANSDVANKIGTVGVALACADAGVPFVVAVSAATVDATLASGGQIPIELRDPAEVLGFAGLMVAPAGSGAYNPAFDVTPARLVTALVTEHGVTLPARRSVATDLPA
jgi:methylthioribose-1-phosphate isomerase